MMLSCLLTGFGCRSLPINSVTRQEMETRMREVLLSSLNEEEPYLRIHALESFAELGTLDVAPQIRKCLYDPIPGVRFAASVAVGDIKDHSARNLLYRMLKENIVSVQLAAAYALEKLGDKRFENWYDNVLYSDNPMLAGQACMLLGKLGDSPLRSESREKLWYVLRKKDQSPGVQLQAAEALARLNDKDILKKLLVFANSVYADDRILAISGLKQIDGPDSFAMLTVLAEDTQIEVQLSAIRALGNRADESYQKIARKAMKYNDLSGDPQATDRVRALAVMALGTIADKKDANLIYKSMHEPSKYIQIASAMAAINYLKNARKLHE